MGARALIDIGARQARSCETNVATATEGAFNVGADAPEWRTIVEGKETLIQVRTGGKTIANKSWRAGAGERALCVCANRPVSAIVCALYALVNI